MSVVTLNIAGYSYKIACQDGQEEHIMELAKYLDEKATKLTNSIGYIQENQLLAMVSVLVTQELFALKKASGQNTPTEIENSLAEKVNNLSLKVSELAFVLKNN